MTVGELKAYLAPLDDHMPIVTSRCSDFGDLSVEDMYEIECLPPAQGRSWHMQLHRTMTPEVLATKVTCLFIG